MTSLRIVFAGRGPDNPGFFRGMTKRPGPPSLLRRNEAGLCAAGRPPLSGGSALNPGVRDVRARDRAGILTNPALRRPEIARVLAGPDNKNGKRSA